MVIYVIHCVYIAILLLLLWCDNCMFCSYNLFHVLLLCNLMIVVNAVNCSFGFYASAHMYMYVMSLES